MTLGELIAQLGGKLAHGAPEKVVTGVNESRARDGDGAGVCRGRCGRETGACQRSRVRGGEAGMRRGLCERCRRWP